jgi:hypothetical protein
VAVTNAGQVMTIILMLMGSFYLAMPLTAAASTFYRVHESYNEKRKRNAAAAAEAKEKEQLRHQLVLQAAVAFAATNIGGAGAGANAKGTGTAGAVAGASSGAGGGVAGIRGHHHAITPASSVGGGNKGKGDLPHANAPVVIYGDYLDRKLQKRITTLMGELYILQSKVSSFYWELQTDTATFVELDSHGLAYPHPPLHNFVPHGMQQHHQHGAGGSHKFSSAGDGSPKAFVEVNKRNVPVLKHLLNASVGNNNTENKSALLKQMNALIQKLEGLLTHGEEDVLRVVVLHHKLRRNY